MKIKAINIKWDIDYDDNGILPTEVEIPEDIVEKAKDDNGQIAEDILVELVAEYLSDTVGYCHDGFALVKE